MDAIEALKGRRSVRVYDDRPVPKETIEEIIDTARLAPTANNVQPWEFVVITDPEIRVKIARLTDWGKFIAQSGACVAVYTRAVKHYLEDGSAAIENILVAAYALGLGTCWVAGYGKDYGEPIREMLGVPEGYKLVGLVALGYPGEKPEAVEKRDLSDVLHWEKY